MFYQMDGECTAHTFVSLFAGCAEQQDSQLASSLYNKFLASGIEHNEHTLSAVISMFVKCGKLETAETVSHWH
jgi:pentatricopeptide repeat protein